MNLANFKRKRWKGERVTFVSANDFFEPMVSVVATRDVSGWADKGQKVKWQMSQGRKYYLTREKAREYAVKGYVLGPDGLTQDVSDDERAQILSDVTIISMGVNNG